MRHGLGRSFAGRAGWDGQLGKRRPLLSAELTRLQEKAAYLGGRLAAGPLDEHLGGSIPPEVKAFQAVAQAAAADLRPAAQRRINRADGRADIAARRAADRHHVNERHTERANASREHTVQARDALAQVAPDRLDDGRLSLAGAGWAALLLLLAVAEVAMAQQVFGLLDAGPRATTVFAVAVAVAQLAAAHSLGGRVRSARGYTAAVMLALTGAVVSLSIVRGNILEGQLALAGDAFPFELAWWHGTLMFVTIQVLFNVLGYHVGAVRHCTPLDRYRRALTRAWWHEQRRVLAAASAARATARAIARHHALISVLREAVADTDRVLAAYQSFTPTLVAAAVQHTDRPDIAAVLTDLTLPPIPEPAWVTAWRSEADRLAAQPPLAATTTASSVIPTAPTADPTTTPTRFHAASSNGARHRTN